MAGGEHAEHVCFCWLGSSRYTAPGAGVYAFSHTSVLICLQHYTAVRQYLLEKSAFHPGIGQFTLVNTEEQFSHRMKSAYSFPRVSVVIPALNEESSIANVVHSVIEQCPEGSELEVIIVDDGSNDRTVEEAERAGATVLRLDNGARGRNPAAARNRGARAAAGDPIVFLDADCVPGYDWLQALLGAHSNGATVVGGAIGLPSRLTFTARCDYYCSWYLIHPRRRAGIVPHHPPPNLSVRRRAYFATSGFSESAPLGYTNEERHWQSEVRAAGWTIYFEPGAVAYHHNRPGLRNLVVRNYRWAYTAIESKSRSGSTRFAWVYRCPRLLMTCALPLCFVHTGYILGCWLRVGVYEPLIMLPLIIASRVAYMTGMVVGGVRWLRRLKSSCGQVPEDHREWSK